MGYWRQRARAVIHDGYRDAKANGFSGRAVRRWITKHWYPRYSAERKKYPYRVWLEELDAVMARELAGTQQLVLAIENRPAALAALQVM